MNGIVKKIALTALIYVLPLSSYASSPGILIEPVSGFTATLKLTPNAAAIIKYKVTNQFKHSVEFETADTAGATHLPADAGATSCDAQKQGLEPQQFCILTLLVQAETLPSEGVHGGPVIRLNAFRSYQPSQADILNITKNSPLPETTLGAFARRIPSIVLSQTTQKQSRLKAAGLSAVNGLALSVNNPSLNAALTGSARTFVIENTGSSATDSAVTYTPQTITGVTISPSDCGVMESGATCTLTVTPDPTTPTASSTTLTFTAGDNTSALSFDLDILSYGSEYQSSYVFSIDDTTATDGSVGGKGAALENQAAPWPFGIIWASNGDYTCTRDPGNTNAFSPCTSYAFLLGINETSTNPPDNCNGNIEGVCDSNVILDSFGAFNDPPTIELDKYAAGLCETYAAGGYGDWSLPSICELGYYAPAPSTLTINSDCGNKASAAIQNMLSNLHDLGYGNLLGIFWSSTQYSTDDGTYNNAWAQYYFDVLDVIPNYQTHDGKEDTSGVRCVRSFT